MMGLKASRGVEEMALMSAASLDECTQTMMEMLKYAHTFTHAHTHTHTHTHIHRERERERERGEYIHV